MTGKADIKVSEASQLRGAIYAETLNLNVQTAMVRLMPIDERIGKKLKITSSKFTEIDVVDVPFENISVSGTKVSQINVYPVKTLIGKLTKGSILKYDTDSENVKIKVETSGLSEVEEFDM